ncbi:hypothetical protein OF83DRAFT_1114529 [Amylostereum chailletii]|nr:hypothetical protein OF83DRAFT_1114529 [Amylostereum chailletii]
MRRIASVFSRRSDKDKQRPQDSLQPDPKASTPPLLPSKKNPRLFGTVSRITVSTDPPLPSLEGHYSSSSSTGSASLQTPEDDGASHMGRSIPTKKWFPWTGNKPPVATSPGSSTVSSYWPEALPVPSPVPQLSTRAPRATPRVDLNRQTADSDDDTSESSSSLNSEAPPTTPQSQSQLGHPLPPREYLTALTANNLAPPFSSPPLFLSPDAPLFPRSSNRSVFLTPRNTLETSMHKANVLGRIQRNELSPTDQRLLATFGPRLSTKAARRTRPQPDEGARLDPRNIKPYSRGLHRWINRPYFEERTAVWYPDQTTGTVDRRPVQGSGFGVWALEVSVALEEMAGIDSDHATTGVDVLISPPAVDDHTWEPSLSASSSSSNLAASLSASASLKPTPYKALPSPLRPLNDATEPALRSGSSSQTITVSPSSPTAPDSAGTKRGVRFAENIDKEDQVPLGYVMRVQKKREEKARFLREERERRRQEEDRLKFEAERQQWEEERRAWDKEKRAMDEERKRKQYSEELAAARARREIQHALPSSSSVREARRNARDAYSRPAYDDRKHSEASSQHSTRPRLETSGSSHQDNTKSVNGSRPPSTFSTHSISSTEDAHRERRTTRRTSGMSESSMRSSNSMYHYGWPTSASPVPPVPPIPTMPPMQSYHSMPFFPTMPSYPSMPMMPVMPQYVMSMDMPLLPPSAPFMSHGASRSRNSSPARSSGSPSRNHSSDRVYQAGAGASRGRAHHRAGSDDHGHPAYLPTPSPTPSDRRPRMSTPAQMSHHGSPLPSMPRSASSSSTPSTSRPYSTRRQTTVS